MENVVTIDILMVSLGILVGLFGHSIVTFLFDSRYFQIQQDIEHLHKQLNNYHLDCYEFRENSSLCSTCRRCGKCRVIDSCKLYSVYFDTELNIPYWQVVECTKYKPNKK